MPHRFGFALPLLLIACAPGPQRMTAEEVASITANYYDLVDDSSPSALRVTLHDAIDDHQRFPFTSTALDTWDILELADEDPNDANRILDVYRNDSYAKAGGGNSDYNREHTWPSSFGFPNDNQSNYPYSDTHALFLSNDSYNSARANRPYRYCDATCTEEVTVANDGRGGVGGGYPGDSNWRSGSNDTGTWETWIGRRGDVARAVLYLDVRYEGGTHGGTGHSEPDLILTDDQALISASITGSNASVAYMGIRSELLRWHIEDPVDAGEIARNDVVFSFQGNRNPFVDHPEWVACAFSDTCGDTTAPATVSGLAAAPGNGLVELDWNDHADPGLIGYFVYRRTGGGAFVRLNGSMVTPSLFADGGVSNGTTYEYVVTAVDLAGNESAQGTIVSATPGASQGASAWINELHYDNASGDVGEFVEVAAAAGTDLTGWSVVGYNGSNGAPYATVSLSGTVVDQGGCIGTLDFDFGSMQNGSPDGLALVDAQGTVLDFISYEGTLVATSGPANGMTSVDIGVSEPTTTPIGDSLQRTGTGGDSAAFTWEGPAPETRGAPNTNQTFDACTSGCTTNGECDDGLFCNGVEICDAGVCVAGSAVDCSGLDDQCNAGICDEPSAQCVASPLAAGTSCDDGDSCTSPDTCDGAGSCSGANICAAGPNLSTVSLTSGAGWSTVALGTSYTSMVVVCAPSYEGATVPNVVRVRNASGSSFEVAAIDAAGTDAPVSGVGIACFVVEEGVYTAAQDGVTMEAVRYDSTVTDSRGSWNGEARSTSNAYANPVVLGQVMTTNDNLWSVFWARGSNRSSPPSSSALFVGKHVAEDSLTSRAMETVGYVVLEAGAGAIEGHGYVADVGADQVQGFGNNPPYGYALSGLASASVAVVSAAGMDGNDGGWPLLYGPNPLSPTGIDLAFDEDTIGGSERRHTTEQVAYIVFE